MKLLVFEWNAFMQADLELALEEMGIAFCRFSYQFDELYEDEYFDRHFGRVLEGGGFDAVISMNYWSLVAKACFRARIPYISWVYDCPLPLNNRLTMSLPTNYVFLFDKRQYEDFRAEGFETVYHVPLAVNTARLDQLEITETDRSFFSSEVSFVGTMYGSGFRALWNELNEYERGYFESLIDSQGHVYGNLYVNDLIPDDMVRSIQQRLEKKGMIDREKEEFFRLWMLDMVSREITRRERFMILSTVSKRHPLSYYATGEEKLLPDARFGGTVDSFSNMYKVFRLSRINLNITFRLITVGMPLRVLDILGAGGFLLSNYQEELVENFQPGRDCVIYESVADAICKIKYYLEHEEERAQIAANGRKAVERFTYQRQLKEIFEIVF